MWLLVNGLAFFILMVPVVVFARTAAWGVRRYFLWRAVKRHRMEIEAFFDWFLRDATVNDREAITDIGWHDDGNWPIVYVKGGGWFNLKREARSPQRYELSIHIKGRFLERFPDYWLRCDESWFNEGMRAMFNVIEAWPREWIQSERARSVASGQPDPLYLNRPSN